VIPERSNGWSTCKASRFTSPADSTTGEESTMALRYEKILHFALRILHAEEITPMKRTISKKSRIGRNKSSGHKAVLTIHKNVL
jgi:hypothetical protein